MNKHRVSIALFAMLAAFSISCFILCPARVVAAPRILFPVSSFDFGEIYQNKTVSHIFTFQNTGDEVLNITEVKTSCGCTAAVLSQKSIKPTETGKIEVSFNSAYRRGKQHKIIYVHSNDPANPITQLTIEALVKVDLEATPANVYFNQIKADQAANQEVVLKNTGQESISILSMQTSPSAGISVKLASEKAASEQINWPLSLKPNESLKIIVSAKPIDNNPRLSGQVRIKTDSKTTPEVIIPVFLSLDTTSAPNRK